MRRWAQGLYIFLVLYGIIYTVFFDVPTTFLDQILAQEADPFAGMVFNFLGLIPLAFLLYFLRYYQLKWFHFGFLLLGFVLGGFASGLIFFFFPEERKEERPMRLAAVLGLVLSILTLFAGLAGSLQAYSTLFIEDSFVHVMTIDLLVLWGFYLALPKYKRSLWQLTFVIGMFYQLLDRPT